MKIIFLGLSLFLLICCSQKAVLQNQSQNELQTSSVIQNEILKQEKPLEKISTPAQKIKLPDVKDFGNFAIIRDSDQKDENGWMIPPYREAKIGASFFNSSPQVGEKVTVVPIKTELKPFQLSISSITERKLKNYAENKEEFIQKVDIELETITDKEILELEPIENYRGQMPFDVFVIYPSVEFAVSLSKTEITKEMIPKDVVMKTIEAAIDLDNDNKPDLLSALFCCGDKLSSYGNCPYLCNKYYKKTNGKWGLFYYDGNVKSK